MGGIKGKEGQEDEEEAGVAEEEGGREEGGQEQGERGAGRPMALRTGGKC